MPERLPTRRLGSLRALSCSLTRGVPRRRGQCGPRIRAAEIAPCSPFGNGSCNEAAKAAIELAREAGLEAVEHGEGAAIVDEVAEGDGVAKFGVFERRLVQLDEPFLHLGHPDVGERGFAGPVSLQAPAADGQFFDKESFGGGGGIVLIDEGLVELVEESAGLGAQADGLGGDVRGGEAVAGGVRGGTSFAFGRDGPFGFAAVGTGRGDATF